MARRKKDSAGGLALLVVGVVAAVSAIPKEAWIVIGILIVIAYAIWLYAKSNKQDSEKASEAPPEPQFRIELNYSPNRNSVAAVKLKGAPVPPRWIPKDERLDIAQTSIPGGLLYYGSDLRAASGDPDPALIEPRLPVSRSAPDCSQRQTDYWPSYSTISADARRTYINWLAQGRNHPQADIGYVFLFFYGLERRALVDATTDPIAKADLPIIEFEVRRLLKLYRGSKSFRGYATSFLEYLSAQRPHSIDSGCAPLDETEGDLSSSMKLTLGRIAVSGKPLSVSWAIAWMRNDPRIAFPKALQRCPEEFEKLFAKQYCATYGEGIKLSVNRTKLRLSYRPASSGFATKEFLFTSEDLPDVTAVIAPAKKLESIVEECANALAPYSRFVGKNPEEAKSLDGILLLPQLLWPDSARTAMQALDKRIGDGLRVTSLGELAASLGGTGTLTREKVRSLAHALVEMRIGMEPDVLAGARTPKPDDKVILFRSDPEDASLRESNVYQAASVSLDLACSVAMADGEPHPNELRLLMKHIDGWAQLSNAQRKRLRARLRMSVDSPPSLASLRNKLDVIPINGKRAIAHLLSTLAQADGVVTPAEVKLLEKVYKALGVEAQAVYSDLHIAGSTPDAVTTSSTPPPKMATVPASPPGLKLDMARIEALQRETAEVSALLSSVFTNEPVVSEEQKEERDEASSIIEPGPLGLDPEHSVFLRLLMTRSAWSRQELSDAAADMELMLDGAIERINEAAFEHFDAALIEGEDPVEVSRDVIEKVTA